MSTTSDAAQLRTLAIDAIRVDDTLNPRSAGDADKLAELTESIRQHGVLQPILVAPANEEGTYVVIAGHRRLAAARAAGLSELPAVVREQQGGALELAVVENVQRANLNPIEEARAFERVLRDGGLSQKRLAELLNVSPALVAERLRLLRLPDDVQEAIASGAIPTRLGKHLEPIAKVSGEIASACAALVVAGVAKPHQLEEEPARVVDQIPRVEWQDGRPCALRVQSWGRYSLDDLPIPVEEIAADIRERAAKLEGGFWFSFSEEDADAARAYGCLLEFRHDRHFRTQFICDPAFIQDRLRLKLDRAEERAAERARWEAERASGRTDGAAEDADEAEADAKEKRREEHRARGEAKREARKANLELGRELAVEYGSAPFTKEAARLLALLVLDANKELAGRGLRYCLEDWQQVERRELKNGSFREKVTYLERWEAQEKLEGWIARPRTPEEILGRLLQALIAAGCADQEAVAQASRVYHELPGTYGSGPSREIPAIVEKLAKKVLPPRLAEQARRRREERERYEVFGKAKDQGDVEDDVDGHRDEEGGRE